VWRFYYYAGAARIAFRVKDSTNNEQVYYLFTDHLGSTNVTSDQYGNQVSLMLYKAWGESRLPSGGSSLTDYRFTGQRADEGIGLYFYNARWYDSAIGRFVQADTDVPINQGVQGLNRYAYVNNNPVRYTDITGQRIDDGCQTEGCSLTQYQKEQDAQKLALLENESNKRKCEAGNDAYCSTALRHPLETITFVGGGLLLAGAGAALIGPTTITAETATTVTTTTTFLCANDGDCTNEIQTGANTVYQVIQNGRTIYVGLTQNFSQRAAYWLSTRSWRPEPIRGLSENLSRFDARAVEQVLIEHYGLENLSNQINSIAATNPIYHEAIQRGKELLNIVNFFGP
jgi:RHS repeat-associated protein